MDAQVTKKSILFYPPKLQQRVLVHKNVSVSLIRYPSVTHNRSVRTMHSPAYEKRCCDVIDDSTRPA